MIFKRNCAIFFFIRHLKAKKILHNFFVLEAVKNSKNKTSIIR